MEKINYEECEFEVIVFDVKDVVCDSNLGGDQDGEWG